MEVAEPRCRFHLRRDVAALEPVDLVQRDHDRDAELEHPSRNEAVTRTDAFACRQHQQGRLDVLECRIDRPLHALGQRIERALEARQIGEHELVVVAVGDPEDPAAGGLGLVRDDCDLAAAERVDERRLADVRPPRDRREARPQAGRSHVSGSSSAAECVTSSPCAFRNVISSIPNSYSHWRQPPHGEAVMPIAAMSPGR